MTVKELKKLLRWYKDDAELIIAQDGFDCQIPLELSISGILNGEEVFVYSIRTFKDGINRRMDTNKVFFNTSNFFASDKDRLIDKYITYYSDALKRKAEIKENLTIDNDKDS